MKVAVSDRTAAVVVQHPNFFGHLEEAAELSRIAKEAGGVVGRQLHPISVGLLKRPGILADIAVAEGQCSGRRWHTAARTSA